ncbi:hypothetical protein [Methylosinus sp. H3A]|uniref:hypothetical protein n=1 Tax=Methylosinus sp. H3A TaxID=2785786 RepID=UPI001FF02BD0|nr:hypothetical protein [Methylosinus sp. H3A]
MPLSISQEAREKAAAAASIQPTARPRNRRRDLASKEVHASLESSRKIFVIPGICEIVVETHRIQKFAFVAIAPMRSAFDARGEF